MSLPFVPRPVHAFALAACLGAACSVGGTGSMKSVIEHPAPVTAPGKFVPVDSTRVIAAADTLAGGGCLSPMKDPVTGVEITLYRSESGLGDYQAPSGSYGLRDDQLIRLECNTGDVLGIVRR